MGRKILAAGLMVLVAVVLVLPLALLGSSLVDNVTALLQLMTHLLSEGPPSQPAWVTDVPVVVSELMATLEYYVS